MKISLIFPPFYLESMYNLPPLGLINLATVLNQSDHDVSIIDFVLAIRQGKLCMGKDIYDDCADRVLSGDPDIVGFSAQCTTYPSVIQISRRIKKKNPEVKVVIGGHNASFVDEITLETYPWVDCIVRGEGEITFKELIAAYKNNKDEEGIDGLTYRSGGRIIRNPDRNLISNLDDLSLPDYSFVPPLEEYRDACELPRSIAILEVGRGCQHGCIYCSESIFWRRRSRTFSVDRLVREMMGLYKNHGAECFVLAYDQFTAHRSFVEEFCRKVIDKGLNHLPWYCISRLDTIDASLLDLMKKAGCESMCFGIDSGSKRTLSFIRKNIDEEILYQRVAETTERGIVPTLSYVIGFPEEKQEDIDQTLTLALKTGILGNNNPLIQIPTVLPGTDLYSNFLDRLVREVDTYFALGIEFNNGSRLRSDDMEINKTPEIFSSFYNLPCPGRSLDELNLIAEFFPIVVNLYPKSFYLLSIECERSVSDLFLEWLSWLKKEIEGREIHLSPQDCYQHFPSFAEEIFSNRKKHAREYIPEVLMYETRALEAAKFDISQDHFQLDVRNARECKPVKNEKIIVDGFEFNLPGIILDMKKGQLKEWYPKQKTFLVFKQEQNQLEVTEINPFGKDFLDLCDGKKRLADISRMLQPKYGMELSPDDFFDSCVEAVQMLGNLKFLSNCLGR